ncbi:MAG: polysulfide reductase NrfD [Planctomycetales bacterium]|nr:polysulfide reductase NrfD [Planctomycetales bacterium]
MRYGFLIDHTRCIGCHACTVACKEENKVPLGVYRTWVKYVEKGTFPDARRFFTVLRCNHCDDAPCITICPTRSLFRRKDGVVDFDNAACIGCKSCMQACPYDALYIEPETQTAAKCNFCAHRLEVGLEPACVVVCPEQAIVAGDLDEPKSRIAQLVAAGGVEVRKPEQGTKPKVFYRGAESASLRPEQLERGEGYLFAEGAAPAPKPAAAPGLVADLKALARTVYDVPHLEQPWGWKVASYLWTKSVAAGALLLAALGVLAGRAVGGPISGTAAAILALVFLAATTGLLVGDLKRPDRFHLILTRPNWSSWLVRGAWILMAFGLLAGLWLLGALLASPFLLQVLSVPSAVAAAATAGYSAFLFHQAEGRDFWQRRWLLLAQLLAAAVAAGSAALLLVGIVTGTGHGAWGWLVEGLALGLATHGVLAGVELLGRHPNADVSRAARVVTDGELRGRFWIGVVGAGTVAPLALLHVGHLGSAPAALACLLALGGLWLWESLWIRAGQSVPLS